jgi:hypothetical protein
VRELDEDAPDADGPRSGSEAAPMRRAHPDGSLAP